jgi:TonB family protein
MGLWEFLRQWQRGRLVTGVVVSLLVHVLVAWALLWGFKGQLLPRWVPKKGDTIIVELPKPEEPANAGSPTAQPPPAPRPAPARPAAPAASRPSPPRETPPAPREERRVASAPRPAEPPAPRAPEPTPRAAEPAPRAPEPAPTAAEPTLPAPKAAEAAPHTPAAAEPRQEGAERQVAAVAPRAPTVLSAKDSLAALRGAGGHGQGRGGIVGDPIRLDSDDPRYNEYLEQIRRRIKEKWGFPCVRTAPGRECDHHTTSLDVHFGILKDGRVEFVEVVRMSDHGVYDEYAVNAIRLAQPFPPVPPAMMAAMRQGSTGLAISARFSYVVESSLTNLLR